MISRHQMVGAWLRWRSPFTVGALDWYSLKVGAYVPDKGHNFRMLCKSASARKDQAGGDECGKIPPQLGVRSSSEGPIGAWRSQGCATMSTAKPLRP